MQNFNPKLTTKIKIVKRDKVSNEITGVHEGSNTITKNALKRFSCWSYDNYHYANSYPRVICDINSDVNYKNVSLLRYNILNISQKFYGEYTTLTINAQDVSKITYGVNDFFPGTDFEFIQYNQIKWNEEPDINNGYPTPGNSATVYYTQMLFEMPETISSNRYAQESAYESELYKDGEYIWRLDLNIKFLAPTSFRDIYGLAFDCALKQATTSSKVSTASHLPFTQETNEILEILYSIYIDYSEAVSSISGLILPETKKGQILEQFTRDIFFENDWTYSYSTPSIWSGYTKGNEYKMSWLNRSFLSKNYPSAELGILKNAADEITDGYHPMIPAKVKLPEYDHTYSENATVLAGLAFGAPQSYHIGGKDYEMLSVCNYIDNYNHLSRGFLHSSDYSVTSSNVNPLKYMYYDPNDIYISSNGVIEVQKEKPFDNQIEPFGFDCGYWVYGVYFVDSGNENTASYKVFKTPTNKTDNFEDIEEIPLLSLSHRSLYTSGEQLNDFFGRLKTNTHSYNNSAGYYVEKMTTTSQHYNTYRFNPDNNNYAWSCLRSEFSDVDDNGYYLAVVNDFEFHIKNVNNIGCISHKLRLNHEKINFYKNTDYRDPSDKDQEFYENVNIVGCVIRMEKDDYQDVGAITIEHRRSDIDEDWILVEEQTITDLSTQISADFTDTRYHWSPIITWNLSDPGNHWRINGLTNGKVYFLTQEDLAMMQSNGGSGKDALEYANTCYGSMKSKTRNYFYVATLEGMLRIEAPNCTGQENIDAKTYSSDLFCPYNNFNFNDVLPRLSMIFPHEEDDRIYMLYSDGSLYVYDETDETFTSINTTSAPWNVTIAPTPQMTKWRDHEVAYNNYKSVRNTVFTWSHTRFVRPQEKIAIWKNIGGDIIVYRNGTVTKINTGIKDYIDFNIDIEDQKYLIAFTDVHQSVSLGTGFDSICREEQYKYDIIDLDTGAIVIANQWLTVALSTLYGRRVSGNILKSSSLHYVISAVGTGYYVGRGTIATDNNNYYYPNQDWEFENSETLDLPCCETFGTTGAVPVKDLQTSGRLKWFTLNGEEYSMDLQSQAVPTFGPHPGIREYGWNPVFDEWQKDFVNPKLCSPNWHNIIDNIQIKFDHKEGDLEADFVSNESMTFNRCKNTIMKDPLQDITNMSGNLYLGKVTRSCHNQNFLIEDAEASYSYFYPPGVSTDSWFLQNVYEESECDIRVVPPYNYNLNVSNYEYLPDYQQLSTFSAGTSAIGSEFISAEAINRSTYLDLVIVINNVSGNVPFAEICNIFGRLKGVNLTMNGDEYLSYYDGTEPILTFLSQTSYSVTFRLSKTVEWEDTWDTTRNIDVLKLDNNMRTIQFSYFEDQFIPYCFSEGIDVGTDNIIRLENNDLKMLDKRYEGFVNKNTFVVKGYRLDDYFVNNSLKFVSSIDGSERTGNIVSSCYNPWFDKTYVTTSNILSPIESPTTDFNDNVDNSTEFCAMSASMQNSYCVAEVAYCYHNQRNDWVDQIEYYQALQFELDGSSDDNSILLVNYDTINDITAVTLDHKPVFSFNVDLSGTLDEGSFVTFNLVSKKYRASFQVSSTINYANWNGSVYTISLLHSAYDLTAGYFGHVFNINDDVYTSYSDDTVSPIYDLPVIAAEFDSSTNSTIITAASISGVAISASPDDVTNIFIAKPSHIFEDTDMSTNIMKIKYNDDLEIATRGFTQEINNNNTTITFDEDLLVANVTDINYIGYSDIINNEGYRLKYTDDSTPNNMEEYHCLDNLKYYTFHPNHKGSILFIKKMFYTSFN